MSAEQVRDRDLDLDLVIEPALWPRVLNRDRLRRLPRPAPLIAGTLDLRTVALLAGYWGTLKTFIGLDWACSVATGRRWHGRTVEARAVLYIAAEGAYGVAQRVNAWEDWNGCQLEADRLHVLPEPVSLGNPASVIELCHLIGSTGYGLVVVDTVAKCSVGLDENSAGDMGRVVHALYRLRDAMPDGDGTVLAIHHTGKDRTTVRGSSAIEAGVDTVYATEGDAKLVRLTRTKRKDGPAHDVLSLTLEPVEGSGSAVLVSAGTADMTESQRTLMSAYLSAFEATGASKAELRAVADMAPATFHRALNALVSAGALVNEGSDGRPFYRGGTQ